MHSDHILHGAVSEYYSVCTISTPEPERIEDRLFAKTRYRCIVLRRDLLNEFHAVAVHHFCLPCIYPEACNICQRDRLQNFSPDALPANYDLPLCPVDHGLKELFPEDIFSEEREGPDEQDHEDRIQHDLLPEAHYQKKIGNTRKGKGCKPGRELPVVHAAVQHTPLISSKVCCPEDKSRFVL